MIQPRAIARQHCLLWSSAGSMRLSPLAKTGAMMMFCLQALLLAAHSLMASRGWRINLRGLAEVQTLLWLPVFLFGLWLSWRVTSFMWHVLTQPYEDNAVMQSVPARQVPQQHVRHASQRPRPPGWP